MRLAQAAEIRAAAKHKIVAVENEIDTVLDRIMSANHPQVIARYEAKSAELKAEKARPVENKVSQVEPQGKCEDKLEPLFQFLSTPWKLWETGEINLRRTVLKLAFVSRIKCDRFEDARTLEISFLFKALGVMEGAVKGSGAPEENNLELFSDVDLLCELEAWSDILASEPMMSERLAEFAAKAEAQGDGASSEHQKSVAPDTPPDAPEVSP